MEGTATRVPGDGRRARGAGRQPGPAHARVAGLRAAIHPCLAERRAQLPARWQELEERDAERIYIARLEGEIVGYARAVFGAEAVFLFGGATAPQARGRGVYTSFVHARWREAAERGTPRLVIQAGAMSAPIVAKLGFREVSTIRLYLDELQG